MNPFLALSTLVSLAGLVVLVGWLWRDYCVDDYRQKLFAIRDDLFDLSRDPNIGLTFGDAAYHQLRTTINGHIRFADRVDVVSALLMSALIGRPSVNPVQRFESEWLLNTLKLGKGVAPKLVILRLRVHTATLKHAVFSVPHLSLLLLPIVLTFGLVWIASQVIQSSGEAIPAAVSDRWGRLTSAIDTAAFDEGCLA